MSEDGVKGADTEESLKPKDITEILVERLVSYSVKAVKKNR